MVADVGLRGADTLDEVGHTLLAMSRARSKAKRVRSPSPRKSLAAIPTSVVGVVAFITM